MHQIQQLPLPELPIYHYQLHFSHSQPISLPKYSGSAWRGAFGHALKRTVCVVRNTPCDACLLKSSCAFAYIFETPPPANSTKMRKYNAIPHPFAFRFDPEYKQNDSKFTLSILLFGMGQRHFPYIVHALKKAGQEGVGSKRQNFQLTQIDIIDQNQNPQTIFDGSQLTPTSKSSLPHMPPAPKSIHIRFHTPVRIKQRNKILNPDTFEFSAMFGNLLRRISMLTHFHSQTPLETDFAKLTRQARELKFNRKNLRWYDWTRYSSRQETEMKMGGVLGEVSLDLNKHPQFWPYLWLGQWTHVGKATSMGMGHFSIETASLPEKTTGFEFEIIKT